MINFPCYLALGCNLSTHMRIKEIQMLNITSYLAVDQKLSWPSGNASEI
jgi:hypothetical protein